MSFSSIRPDQGGAVHAGSLNTVCISGVLVNYPLGSCSALSYHHDVPGDFFSFRVAVRTACSKGRGITGLQGRLSSPSKTRNFDNDVIKSSSGEKMNLMNARANLE